MSVSAKIIEDIKTFLDENENYNKKELLAACGKAFDQHKKKSKGKKSTTTDEEEKPKKELTGYQKFVKEHMPLLKAREDVKDDGETKKKASELMKEIGELWQTEKEAKK